jgi:hypothetical protein
VYRDTSPSDIQDIMSFEESHIHRDFETAVVAAAAQHSVKTAMISPPMIHGVGNGSVKTRSIQVPILIENILKRRKHSRFWKVRMFGIVFILTMCLPLSLLSLRRHSWALEVKSRGSLGATTSSRTLNLYVYLVQCQISRQPTKLQ